MQIQIDVEGVRVNRLNTSSRAACYVTALTGATVALVGAATPASADEESAPTVWNGHRIYLSPARHTDAGSRGECQLKNENTMAYGVASVAGNSSAGGLTSRGYKVRIGTGTYQSAVSNSNAWGANAHVVLHSNSGAGSGTCASRSGSSRGTHVMYTDGSLGGASLSQRMLDEVAGASPVGGIESLRIQGLARQSAPSTSSPRRPQPLHTWRRSFMTGMTASNFSRQAGGRLAWQLV